MWIYTTTAYLALAITLFCLARISPYEWDDDGEGSATNVGVILIIVTIVIIFNSYLFTVIVNCHQSDHLGMGARRCLRYFANQCKML